MNGEVETLEPTCRLDREDVTMVDFHAVVTAHGRWKGGESVVLDRSAFYPESGGQLPDLGQLGDAAVRDVQVDEEGVVHHLISGQLPRVGAEVRCVVDAARRRQHMVQHTAQHLLSWALTTAADAPTASSRLGEKTCTIDVRRRSLPEADLRRAVALVVDAIEADHPVRCFYPAPEELARLPLRRRPKVSRGVRVVAMGDFEHVPCGGTHCLRTSHVGLVTVLSTERYKGMSRVTFAAGRRALSILEERSRTLATIGRDLTCGALDVPAAVEGLRGDLGEARRRLEDYRSRYASSVAAELAATSEGPLVVAALDGADRELLRAVGKQIVSEPGRVALLCAPGDDGSPVFVARGQGSALDCGAFVRAATELAGGRGGGRPGHAEGQLPARVAWVDVVRRLVEAGDEAELGPS